MQPDLQTDRARLKAASVGGVAVNLVAQTARFGLQFLYQVGLARLLAPADFGVVAMAAPMLAFVGLFADFGLTQATVQKPDMDAAQLTFIFWANLALSGLAGAVAFAAAPAIALFYGDERVGGVVTALSATFLLGGLGAQHLALLNRRLAFVRLAAVDLASFVAGAGAGLVAALHGAGYRAVVVTQLVTSAASLALAWGVVRFVPGRPRWTAEARGLLGFGRDLTGFNLANFFARNLDNVLIGRFAGEASLGLYDRAYKLLLLPLGQITGPFAKVATPLLARLHDDSEAYCRAYLRLLETVLLLTYPGMAFALVSSDLLIPTVLGPQWAGVSPIFSILALGGFFAPVSNSAGWLFVTQGRTREMRDWGFVSSAMFVLSFVAGLRWGAIGVAACYIGVGAVIQGPMIWWASTRRGPVGLSSLLASLAPCLVALLVTLATERGLQAALPADALSLAILAAAAYPSFVAGLLATGSGRRALRAVQRQARQTLWRSAA